MNDEDLAISALQTITKEINLILQTIKESRKDLRPMELEDKAKLDEILNQLNEAKGYIVNYLNRYNKQTNLNQFADD
jgi:signal transduction histidine kinase